MNTFATLLFVSLFLFSCSNPKHQILGKWKMDKVLEREANMSHIHNPHEDRWIRFYQNGSFESGGKPYGRNSGRYTLNTEKQIIYLDSDAGEDDDSKWQFSLSRQKMNWTGIGSERQRSTKILYSKIE